MRDEFGFSRIERQADNIAKIAIVGAVLMTGAWTLFIAGAIYVVGHFLTKVW